MYRKPDDQLRIDDFILPFEGKLSNENRWVTIAEHSGSVKETLSTAAIYYALWLNTKL